MKSTGELETVITVSFVPYVVLVVGTTDVGVMLRLS